MRGQCARGYEAILVRLRRTARDRRWVGAPQTLMPALMPEGEGQRQNERPRHQAAQDYSPFHEYPDEKRLKLSDPRDNLMAERHSGRAPGAL